MVVRPSVPRLRIALAAVFVGAVLAPAAAPAQNLPLADLLPELILGEITLQSAAAPPGIPGVPAGFSHLAHFSPFESGDLNNPAVGIVQGFNTQIANQFATFPLGSSTGGLTYVFDETVGTLRRGSASFGPLFAERALTIGRGKLSAGMNYQRTSYDSFEGSSLDDASIKFYLRHQDCCGIVNTPGVGSGFVLTPQANGTRLNPNFEGDLIEAALTLKATTHTTAFFANYGLTSAWDIGVAVPVMRVKLDASVTARVLRLVTGVPGVPPASLDLHTFEVGNPNATRTVRHSDSAAGIGDVVVRSKYRFLPMGGGGLAVAVDLRLPTGDKDELLGAGGAQAKFLLVASNERGRFAPHVNVGYTAAAGESAGAFAGLSATPLPDEINYSGGVEFVPTPRLTIIGDVVGRTLRGAGRLEMMTKQFEFNDQAPNLAGMPGPGCAGIVGGTCASVSLDEFEPRSGDLTLLLGTAGVKFNPAGNWLVSGSVLWPLTDAGLRSRATVVVGLDYAF
jgi:hypothetical protein